MNKKIFGFLLVAASLFSVCSLESCKDTNTDLWNEVMIKQNNLYQDLLNRIEAIKECPVDCEAVEKNVKSLMEEQANIKAAIEALQAKDADLQKQIDALKNKDAELDAKDAELEAQIKALKELVEKEIAELKEKDADLQNQIDALKDEVKGLKDKDADLQSQIDELKKRIEDLENNQGSSSTEVDLTEINNRITIIENKIDILEQDYADLRNYCNCLQDKINKLLADVADLKDRVGALEAKVANLEAEVIDLGVRLGVVEETLKDLANRATGITVQAVWNPLFGIVNTPVGIASNMLVAAYKDFGTVNLGTYEYPYTVEGGFDNDVIGKIYLTVDPTNVDFSGVATSLVNSQGGVSKVQLSPLAQSSELLQVGVTRASNLLYETEATISDINDVERFSLDKSGFKEALKDIVNYKDGIDVSDIVELLGSTLNQKMTAYAVAIEQKDANAGQTSTKNLVSKFDIAATVITPLNLTQVNALGDILGKVDFEAKLSNLKAKVDAASSTSDDNINSLMKTASKLIDEALGKCSSIDRIANIAKPVIFCIDGDELKFLSRDESNPTVLTNSNVTLYATSYSQELIVPFCAKLVYVGDDDMKGIFSKEGGPLKCDVNISGKTHIEYTVVDYSGKPDNSEYWVTK